MVSLEIIIRILCYVPYRATNVCRFIKTETMANLIEIISDGFGMRDRSGIGKLSTNIEIKY